GAAQDVLRRARGRRAGAAAADAGHAPAAAGPRRAHAALDQVAAAVAGRTAADVLLCAGLRRAGGRAAGARHAAAAAGLAGRAHAAVERAAAAVAGRAAADVLLRAGQRGAHGHVGRHAGAEVEDHELEQLLLRRHRGDAHPTAADAVAALGVRRARLGVLE